MDNKPLKVLDRLESLEQKVHGHSETMDTMFGQFRSAFQSQLELVEALMDVLKDYTIPDIEKKLEEKVETKRKERALAKSESEKQQLEELVKNNVFSPTDKVNKNCVVVGRIYNADGTVNGSGRVQVDFNSLNQETQVALLGQEVGFVYETPKKEKLEVLEVYELVDQKPLVNPESPAVPVEATK